MRSRCEGRIHPLLAALTTIVDMVASLLGTAGELSLAPVLVGLVVLVRFV